MPVSVWGPHGHSVLDTSVGHHTPIRSQHPNCSLHTPGHMRSGEEGASAAKECLSPCRMPLEALRTRDAPTPLLAM